MAFVKGTSGNPKGRPKIRPDVRDALRALTPLAVAKLGELMNDPDPKVALKACVAVLDRTLPHGAPIRDDLPTTEPDRVEAVEAALVGSAIDGDSRAGLAYLQARDPKRWPRGDVEGDNDDDSLMQPVEYRLDFDPEELRYAQSQGFMIRDRNNDDDKSHA